MTAQYFPVISDPSQAHKVDRAMVALHRINTDFQPPAGGWMLDSGGYQQITKRGEYDLSPREYVEEVNRLSREVEGLICAFQQDFVLGEDVSKEIHGEDFPLPHYSYQTLQGANTARFSVTQKEARRVGGCDVPIAPVLHGRTVDEYVRHARRLSKDPQIEIPRFVGIGSLKAEKDDIDGRPKPTWMRKLTIRLRQEFPRAHFHALGVGKKYVLSSVCGATLQRELYSYDTAAWSVAARWNEDWTTGDNHDVVNARRYGRQIEEDTVLPS